MLHLVLTRVCCVSLSTSVNDDEDDYITKYLSEENGQDVKEQNMPNRLNIMGYNCNPGKG